MKYISTIDLLNSEPLSPINSGWKFLDQSMWSGGIESDRIIMLMGRPKSGKTYFLLNWIVRLMKAGTKCYFFSAEMNRRDVVYRIISMLSNTPVDEITARMKVEPFYEWVVKMSAWVDSMVFIDDRKPLFISQIGDVLAGFDGENIPGFIFIDHHLCINAEIPDNSSMFASVNYVLGQLELYKKAYKQRIVLAVQMSRAGGDGSTIPRMNSGKGSGKIEEVGDAFVGIGRPGAAPNCPRTELDVVNVSILANRYGPAERCHVIHKLVHNVSGELKEGVMLF